MTFSAGHCKALIIKENCMECTIRWSHLVCLMLHSEIQEICFHVLCAGLGIRMVNTSNFHSPAILKPTAG